MTALRTRIRKFTYWLKHELLTFDNVVLAVALVICFACTWGAISSMSRNWNLAQELASRERERALLELEVETLELENEYYQSDEYLELSARKYRDKKQPGETVIYLPANSEAALTKHKSELSSTTALADDALSNFQQWLKFLFGI